MTSTIATVDSLRAFIIASFASSICIPRHNGELFRYEAKLRESREWPGDATECVGPQAR